MEEKIPSGLDSKLWDNGCIYKITCKTTKLSYIGQAKYYMFQNNKWKLFGSYHRFKAHAYSAKSHNDTIFHKDINKYGEDDFIIEELWSGPIDELDWREAEYIESEKTLWPNGYNNDSTDRARSVTGIIPFIVPRAKKARMHVVKSSGIKSKIDILVTLKDNREKKFSFGSGRKTYDQGLKEAEEFVRELQKNNILVTIEPEVYSDDPLAKYFDKIEATRKLPIERVMLSIRNDTGNGIKYQLAAITLNIKGERKQRLIRFGTKNIPIDESYKLAKMFIERLKLSHDIPIIIKN